MTSYFFCVEEMKVRGMGINPGAPGFLNLLAPCLLGQGRQLFLMGEF